MGYAWDDPWFATSVLHRLVNRQVGARVFSPIEATAVQIKNRFCKPICKPDAAGRAETGEMQKAGDDFTPQVGRGVVVPVTQRQQVHNRDMTQERRHANGHGLVAVLHWVRSHLPRWRRRPPTVGVREPRRPKPTLPAAAVALKEPRTGLMHWIKLGNRHTGEHT